MKFAALALLGLFAVTACEQQQQRLGDETGQAVDAADTMITSEQNVDTTIITRDTSVEVDTIRQEGDQPVSEDTLQQTSPSSTTTPGADTGLIDTTQQ
jgi:hypothetical protein